MGPSDHFSSQADAYARYRPTYPPELFAWLAARAPERLLAWDAGCGSGQAATALAAHFARVVATDPSGRQLERARPHPRVAYRRCAERVPEMADSSTDLVTVAQALHWFDRAAFFAECGRVLKTGGMLAVWTYDLLRISPAVDAVVGGFYGGLESWWPPQRRLVENGYAGIALPGESIASPAFAMTASWTLEQVLGYLESWSAVAACRQGTGADPVAEIAPSLAVSWGDPGRRRHVTWPLTLLAARFAAA